MARFIVAWELGGGMGHVTTLRPFVQHLIDRGHEVTAILRDLSRADSTFQRPSVRFFQAPLGQAKLIHKYDKVLTFAQLLHNVGFENTEDLSTRVRAWRTLFDIIDPAMILFDHSPTALLAARGLPAKRVLVGTGFFSPPDQSPWPQMHAGPDPSPLAPEQVESQIVAQANTALRGIQAPPLDSLSQLYGDVEENILMTFPELDPYPQRRPSVYFGTWSSAVGHKPVWPTGPGPRIFAYLKPFAGLERLLRRLRELDHPTLVVVDGVEESVRRECSSDRMQIGRQPLELSEIGKTCDLAILNGTHGTTTSLLLSGRPILQIPLVKEQVINSRAVVRMGAGLLANPNAPDDIVAKLDQLLSASLYTRQARRFAAHHRRFDSVRQEHFVVRHIEHLALGTAPAINARRIPSELDPQSFVRPHRLDLMAKVLYFRQLLLGIENDWCTRLYLDHLKIINGVWNSAPMKTQHRHFLHSNRELLTSVQQHGLTAREGVVSATSEGNLINGAHRVALALLLGLSVPAVNLALPSPDYSLGRFQEGANPLSADQLNAMTVEFVRFHPQARVGIVYGLPNQNAPVTSQGNTAAPPAPHDCVLTRTVSVPRLALRYGCGLPREQLPPADKFGGSESPISIRVFVTTNESESPSSGLPAPSMCARDHSESIRWATTLLSVPTLNWWSRFSPVGPANAFIDRFEEIAKRARQLGLSSDDFGIIVNSDHGATSNGFTLDIVAASPTLSSACAELGVRPRLLSDQAHITALFDPTQCIRIYGLRLVDRR